MRIKKGSLSYWILLSLEKSADCYTYFEDFTKYHFRYARGYQNIIKKSELSQALKRLRERGLIDESVDKGKVIFKLSQMGRTSLLSKYKEEEKWDGKWRIIAFDIPEESRMIRRVLRSKLKEWEFIKIQQSVWATKRNVIDDLKKIVEELGIQKWVVLMEAEKIYNTTGPVGQ